MANSRYSSPSFEHQVQSHEHGPRHRHHSPVPFQGHRTSASETPKSHAYEITRRNDRTLRSHRQGTSLQRSALPYRYPQPHFASPEHRAALESTKPTDTCECLDRPLIQPSRLPASSTLLDSCHPSSSLTIPWQDPDTSRIYIAAAIFRLDHRLWELSTLAWMLVEPSLTPSQEITTPQTFPTINLSPRVLAGSDEIITSFHGLRPSLQRLRDLRSSSRGSSTPGVTEELADRIVSVSRTMRKELQERYLEYKELKSSLHSSPVAATALRAFEREGALETLRVKVAVVIRREILGNGRDEEREKEIRLLKESLGIEAGVDGKDGGVQSDFGDEQGGGGGGDEDARGGWQL